MLTHDNLSYGQSPPELNNMAWGFARLGHRSERADKLFSGVAKELIRRTWQFKPQDIGTTVSDLGCPHILLPYMARGRGAL